MLSIRYSNPLLTITFLFTLIFISFQTLANNFVDGIAAIVNDDVITKVELERELAAVSQQQRLQNLPLPPTDVLTTKVLEHLVTKRVQLQMANANGISVDDVLLNDTLLNIAQNNGLTLSQFHDRLELDGINFGYFRENMRDEMTLTQLRQRFVDSRINVTDQEIDDFINSKAGLESADSEYHLGHILVAVPEAASAQQIQQAKNEIDQIYQQLIEGDDFNKIAIENSDGQQALKGGDLGWRPLSEIPSLFTNTILELSIGGTSEPIRSPSGFHIVKLLGQRSANQHITTQTLARHILITPDAIFTDDDARKQLSVLKTEIENGADFAALASQFSKDKGSASQGGDLGWITPGTMVSEFEQAMQGLKPGQLSAPVKSRFGWHLIQVLDRRDLDDTDEFIRNKIRQQVFQRKVEDAYEVWLQRLRSEAYVEFRLDNH